MVSLAETVGWLFGWLLRNSAHATVLAGVVWLLERSACRGLSPRWRYGLWLLVVVRLAIPIAPGSPLSLFNLFDFAPASLASVFGQVLGLPSPVPVALPEMPHPLADTPPWFLWALALWVPGALILGGLLWRDQLRLQDALSGTPVLDEATLGLLVQSKAVMCVRQRVELVETARISSPAITGWWRPRVLLPLGLLERLTRDETRFLFLHEMAHVKRWDIALNWCLAVVQVLHWFNPVVWFALRRLLTVREEVCDDLVLRRSFQGASREYGLTLIRLLEECAPRRLLPAYAGVLDDVRSLRQRVRCIRDFTMAETNPWSPACLTVVVAVVGLTERPGHHALSAGALPAYAEVRGRVWHSALRQETLRPASPAARRGPPPPTSPTSPQPVRMQQQPEGPAADVGVAGDPGPRDWVAFFRTAFDRALGELGAMGGVAEAATPAPGAVAVAVAVAPSTVAPRPPPTASRVMVTPVRSSHTASRGAGQGALPPAAPVRPGPLPPVSERGSILRPHRLEGDSTTTRAGLNGGRTDVGAGGMTGPGNAAFGMVRRPSG